MGVGRFGNGEPPSGLAIIAIVAGVVLFVCTIAGWVEACRYAWEGLS